jgi:hypothetical protein
MTAVKGRHGPQNRLADVDEWPSRRPIDSCLLRADSGAALRRERQKASCTRDLLTELTERARRSSRLPG